MAKINGLFMVSSLLKTHFFILYQSIEEIGHIKVNQIQILFDRFHNSDFFDSGS